VVPGTLQSYNVECRDAGMQTVRPYRKRNETGSKRRQSAVATDDSPGDDVTASRRHDALVDAMARASR
jgi:hypothetical protein